MFSPRGIGESLGISSFGFPYTVLFQVCFTISRIRVRSGSTVDVLVRIHSFSCVQQSVGDGCHSQILYIAYRCFLLDIQSCDIMSSLSLSWLVMRYVVKDIVLGLRFIMGYCALNPVSMFCQRVSCPRLIGSIHVVSIFHKSHNCVRL